MQIVFVYIEYFPVQLVHPPITETIWGRDVGNSADLDIFIVKMHLEVSTLGRYSNN